MIIEQYGTHNWVQIGSMMPGRNVRQCIDRWKRNNSPRNPKREWTSVEDSILLDKYNQFGGNYAVISQFLAYRNEVSVKNRLNQLLESKFTPKVQDITPIKTIDAKYTKKADNHDAILDRILTQVGLDAFADQFDLSTWAETSDIFSF